VKVVLSKTDKHLHPVATRAEGGLDTPNSNRNQIFARLLLPLHKRRSPAILLKKMPWAVCGDRGFWRSGSWWGRVGRCDWRSFRLLRHSTEQDCRIAIVPGEERYNFRDGTDYFTD
jgi:hypothetical protein